jgi:anti-sigma factor RsiW
MDRLSEYLSGSLPPEETRDLEAHLEGCERCARVLEELGAVVRATRALEDQPPPRDLWPGILERMARGEARVLSLSDHRQAARRRSGGLRGQVRLSVPQAIAATLVLAFGSAGSAWMVGRSAGRVETLAVQAPVVQAAPGQAEGGVLLALSEALSSAEASERAAEIARLERSLTESRGRLHPSTLRILDKNLAVIDAAIQESIRALELDPDNQFLIDHLEGTLSRKLSLLRQTVVGAERVS